MINFLSRLFCLCILAGMLAGCGIIDAFYLPPPEDTAQELFEAGNDAMRENDYLSASRYFSKLKDNFPFSPYAVESELSLADSYFLDEEWLLAAEAYKEFESLHPRHQAIPYVLFNIGMANMNAYPSIDRPTTQIEEAYSYFRRLAESYPGTEYAEVARERMHECRNLMAEHELYYADFYFRMKRYTSALTRYRHMLEEYKDVPEIYDHVNVKAKAAFIKEREQRAEGTREEREGTWKHWFRWL